MKPGSSAETCLHDGLPMPSHTHVITRPSSPKVLRQQPLPSALRTVLSQTTRATISSYKQSLPTSVSCADGRFMPCRPHDISRTEEKFFHPNPLIIHVRPNFMRNWTTKRRILTSSYLSVLKLFASAHYGRWNSQHSS